MVMTPYDHQVETAKQAMDILNPYRMVYLAAQERTGKSITGLLVFDACADANDVLILTKKKALKGWNETLDNTPWKVKNYTVTNYHGAVKVNPNDFDAVILDEAHSYISACPKRSNIWKNVAKICGNKPIVYMSATPYAQGIHLLFNQLAVSENSPWSDYPNYYEWYYDYAETDEHGQRLRIKIKKDETRAAYGKVKFDKALSDVEHLFITKTRASVGFKQEPEDVIHYIELSQNTKDVYNFLLKNKVLRFNTKIKPYTLVGDSIMKLRTALHMLEGGVLKVGDDYIDLNNREKIDYMMRQWGDYDNVAIMYQYIAEGAKLRTHFTKATILQGTSYAEGVDLSHIEHLVIYSQDFSTAKHTQRRARQANQNRTLPINVHFLLVKKGVSSQVYRIVSINKTNYVDSLFEEEEI